jgi:cellobiose phosphorylase
VATAPIDEPPLRAELFSITQLQRHAHTLAGWHVLGGDDATERLLPRLAENEASLAAAYALITDAVIRGRQITPAAEWFIDNYHVIEDDIRTARRHLPVGYSRELPRISNGVAGTPRVYSIAIELISHSHGRVDLEALRAFVTSYEAVQPLSLGELWAIPIMLRFALIENLRRVMAAVTAGRRDRELAGVWAERLLAVNATDPSRVVLVLAEMIEQEPALSHPFVAELASRIQGHGQGMVFPMSWLEQRLLDRGQTTEQLFHLASQSQAADQVSIGNSIGSLRFLRATDWRDFVEETSAVEQALRTDPGYGAMDFRTRDRYRHVVEAVARKSPLSELEVATLALGLSRDAATPRTRHVGYFLVDGGRRRLEAEARMRPSIAMRVRRAAAAVRFPLYVGAIALLTVALTIGVVLVLPDALTLPLRVAFASVAFLCASQLATSIVHWVVTSLVAPSLLPRLDFAHGIPDAHRTLVAVPTMMTSVAGIDGLVAALEVRFLANRDANLGFALVADLRDAAQESLEDDAMLIEHATRAIEQLGEKYAEQDNGGFFLFYRARRWNPRESVWMGWERKRGKLEELNATLRGEKDRFARIVGPLEKLDAVKYVIALDSDTDLPRDTAAELAGTLGHPLNRPVFDERRGRVTEGYGILQPRVAITLESSNASRYASWFAGECGIDPYTRAVSDVYQDVFDEGSFVGKGIYDIDAVERALAGRLPENRILSHDLLESGYARSALVSDVILYEDYPAAYSADASRRARWIRGDWQIARWLFGAVPGPDGPRANPLSLLSRWKIGDNLRRSMVPLALLALWVLGWMVPGAAVPTTVLGLATLVLPNLLASSAAAARRPIEVTAQKHYAAILDSARRQTVRDAFLLATLPYDAWLGLVSTTRACFRMLITRKHLLEWRTAADAQRSADISASGTYGMMWVLPATALAALTVLVYQRSAALWLALPVALAWLVAPAMVSWASHAIPRTIARLTTTDRVFLRGVARRTWRFFEDYVAAEDNDLPPDNVQEDPPVGIAHRTSPTNIGMALLSNLAGYDFGYIGQREVAVRTKKTLETMDRMDRYRGHFYNWYDTRTLEPLRPTYVSTVDSGNLAGHLVTLAAGLEELAAHPVLRAEHIEGLVDTLNQLADASPAQEVTTAMEAMRELLRDVPETVGAWQARLTRIDAACDALVSAVAGLPEGDVARRWVGSLRAQCERAASDLAFMVPWASLERGTMDQAHLERFDRVPSLIELTTVDGLDDTTPFGEALLLASKRAVAQIAELRALALRSRAFADIDYDLLYDRKRQLLAIGYDVQSHRLDAGFYDLLASEARLASYVAIAQGKLPQEHWFNLGRLLTTTGGRPALLSWSGSMFEYLMPLLVMPDYEGTLLHATYAAVVERQRAYGRQHDVPWGVSESGYNKTDIHLNYQYRAFGVPGLGFKRGLADDLVVTPYASVMGLMIDPDAACANLRRLAAEGQLGEYGFYEAVDYTAKRLPPGKTSVTVRSYMSHHQGMAFLSLGYELLGRPMQRRFELDPSMRATTLLLQERVPRTPSVHPHPAETSMERAKPTDGESDVRVIDTPNTPTPEVHLLSNGRYHVAVTNAGGGYSRWGELAVTRWQEDTTRDCWGTFVYVRDVGTGSFWSVAHQPTLRAASSYEAVFSQGRAAIRRRDAGVDLHVEISVSPEDDVELRRISISNLGETTRTIELTSYAEVVLATPAADAAHRAFSNLFVQTELVRDRHAILCTRRPRSGQEKPPFMLHLMTVHGRASGATSYETDRAAFVGRGGTLADPQAMHRERLGDSAGAVLDPIVAIRNTVEVRAGQTVRVHVVTGVADTREHASMLIEKYADRHVAERVLELAWTQAYVLQRRLDATAADALLFQRLAGSVLYTNRVMRAPRAMISRNRLGQSGLWAHGISGDVPIALVRIGDGQHIELVRQMLRAHAYWRLKGLIVDLVIWNEDPSGYRQDVQEQIMSAVSAVGDASLIDRPGGIFVRRGDQMTDDDRVLVQTIARLIVSDSAGTLAEQFERKARSEVATPPVAARRGARARVEASGAIERPDLHGWNGHGGFTPDGREYVIVTTRSSRTPLPWVNVLANPYFGTVVSESGGAYTWCENAHSYRLTPWNNDPVSDTSGEAMYLRDEDDGHFWSPTPLPCGGAAPYTTRHGFGYSIFETEEGGIESQMRTFVATDAPVKFVVITLANRSGRARRLSLTGVFDLVLGAQRPANLPHVVTEVDPRTGALFGRNPYAAEFAPRVAFLECSEAERSVTGDRTEILGRNGESESPATMYRIRLSGRVGAGLDPCLAMQTTFELVGGESKEIAFMLGSGRDLDDARHIVERFRGVGPAQTALDAVWEFWKRTVGQVNVKTPDASLDFLANGWLVYQVLACRMWGRSGFYQSGGAFGFRDQLQDAMAMLHAEPTILREQLLRAAAHQFAEGDVQHWWHPPLGRGVRTRISDDYLWLPYAVCRYVGAVGDTGVLDEHVEFLQGRLVNPHEDSYYDLPSRTADVASLYVHCVRAIENGLRFGAHGLPLMGSGDWNDGMNLVGDDGKGESVWLAFFLHDVLTEFAVLARSRGDGVYADACMANATRLAASIEAHGWDGEWYRRAYFDDGTPLGSKESPECQIDSLPQSWAQLTGVGDPARARAGLDAVKARLVDPEMGVIKLFDPPFDSSPLEPGYIKGYVPGVRENGGQYTHAAVWATMAFAAAGRTREAWELFEIINPVRHGDSRAAIEVYKAEPYVVAADVYTNPQHAGRGGWTWYTGSAGWMYRLILESLLGVTLDVDRLRLAPRIPADWDGFTLHYRYRETVHHVEVKRTGPGNDVRSVTLDGVSQDDLSIPLVDDRTQHRAMVEIG